MKEYISFKLFETLIEFNKVYHQ